MTQLLHFKHCCGCGQPAKNVRALVALPAERHICDECVLTMAAIIANQGNEGNRIHFVDEMQVIMREPIEIVAKWKALREKQATTLSSVEE